MIPKTIHYCWFGRNPKPKLAEKCIRSWKKYCPDYEIIEWNEDNFDISSAPLYVRQAYEARKWAFVTDYVRLWVVYEHGGIYLDTDVEVIGKLTFVLHESAFFCFECGDYVNTGLGFGAEKGHSILKEMMQDYENGAFILPDGSFDTTPCPIRNTEVLCRNGLKRENSIQILKDNIKIFPEEYFCPKNYFTGEINITANTSAIHHYDASWIPEKKKRENTKRLKSKQRKARIKKIRSAVRKLGETVLGEKLYKKLRGIKD